MEGCVGCYACVDVCPMEAVSAEGTPPRFAVDPERCTECTGRFTGPLCVAACIAACIEPDPGRRETDFELRLKHRALTQGRPWSYFESYAGVDTDQDGAPDA